MPAKSVNLLSGNLGNDAHSQEPSAVKVARWVLNGRWE